MRNLSILVLMVLAATAVGAQSSSMDAIETNVTCPDPCYVAPYFTASGGFVGEAAKKDDAKTPDKDEGAVNFAVTCGNRVTKGSVEPDAKGIVRQVFNMANGYGCADAGGKLEIDNLKPGGWYWIHDDPNSAVASLVNRNVLGNANMVKPTNPGGVTMTAMKDGAATFVKHEASGRVGILSHIMPMKDSTLCSVKDEVSNDCLLMASYEIDLMVGTGKKATDIGSGVTRGTDDTDDDEDITISITLGGKGFLTYDTDTSTEASDQTVGWAISNAGAGGADSAANVRGIRHDPDTDPHTITIEPDQGSGGRCASDNIDRGNPIKVTVTLTSAAGYIPAPKAGAAATATDAAEGMTRSFTVSCGALPEASSQGQSLVPENLFPVN